MDPAAVPGLRELLWVERSDADTVTVDLSGLTFMVCAGGLREHR